MQATQSKNENTQSAKALATQSIPPKKIKQFDVTNDPDLLRRSEQIFNQQSAAQKMKIFNEMELYIKQQQSAEKKEISASAFK